MTQLDPNALGTRLPIYGGSAGPLPTGYLTGLHTAYVGVTQVSIEPGRARSDDDAVNIDVDAQLVADITVLGPNGRDAGLEAPDTWYSIWIIDGPLVPVASLLSTSPTAPVLPTGYFRKRRVGWVYNDAGGDFRFFRMYPETGTDRVVKHDNLDESVVNVLNAGVSVIPVFTDVDLSVVVPPTSTVAVMLALFDGDNINNFAAVRPNGDTEDNPALRFFGASSSAEFRVFCPGRLIEFGVLQMNDSLSLWTLGYIDSL